MENEDGAVGACIEKKQSAKAHPFVPRSARSDSHELDLDPRGLEETRDASAQPAFYTDSLGLSVFSESVGYQIFERTAAQFVGEKAAAIMREAFALADLGELSELLKTAEFSTVQMHTKTLPARFASARDFIDYQLGGRLASAVSTLSDETRTALVAALLKAFEPYMDSDGLAFPMEAHVVLARK